jgi:hypothetical protein
MVRNLQPIGARYGSKRPNTADDLIDDRTLSQHSFIPVIEQEGTSTRYFHWGVGIENADTNVGRLSLDLQVADDAGGTNAADAKGIARFAVYPDDPAIADGPKAVGDAYTLAELRDLAALNHRDRDLFPVMKPGASQDEYLVLEVKLDASQDGQVVYAEGSSVTAPYSEVKVRRQ